MDVPSSSVTVKGGAAEEGLQTILGPTEHLELPLEDITSANAAHERYPWFPEDVATQGADWQQSRAACRLAFYYNFMMIQDHLEFLAQQLSTIEVRDQMAQKGFQIAGDRPAASLLCDCSPR